MALTTAEMKRDSVLTCAIAAARHTLKTGGAINLHTGGERRSKCSRVDASLQYMKPSDGLTCDRGLHPQ